ncbi:hypothetical protein P153DRAFT_92615 [Dothidotthia symphoricarpi CBS 119687]|uniref:Uncharacterized protein n=1 Tax=Dothidotthia symphoricarpi CBS 119687 TaxID=1392245 RepID=A0A6A6A4P8_9PLEO|nr:uncharacterized protein P153DRAFT_92615 [Dothidotthia symphoricarpi CBS 119687]KAF2125738.1 hypothetical protein P153DRAFT_92615 [Dothidotthia symphoricarpi CBS 119687]
MMSSDQLPNSDLSWSCLPDNIYMSTVDFDQELKWYQENYAQQDSAQMEHVDNWHGDIDTSLGNLTCFISYISSKCLGCAYVVLTDLPTGDLVSSQNFIQSSASNDLMPPTLDLCYTAGENATLSFLPSDHNTTSTRQSDVLSESMRSTQSPMAPTEICSLKVETHAALQPIYNENAAQSVQQVLETPDNTSATASSAFNVPTLSFENNNVKTSRSDTARNGASTPIEVTDAPIGHVSRNGTFRCRPQECAGTILQTGVSSQLLRPTQSLNPTGQTRYVTVKDTIS